MKAAESSEPSREGLGRAASDAMEGFSVFRLVTELVAAASSRR